MHRLTGKDYFTQAGRTFLARGARKADYAYLCGFLCHFALDCACHGYINDLAARGEVSHEEIESEFDRILLEEDARLTSPELSKKRSTKASAPSAVSTSF